MAAGGFIAVRTNVFFFLLYMWSLAVCASRFLKVSCWVKNRALCLPREGKEKKKRCSCSCMEAFQADVSITGTGEGGGCTHVMHGRSRMTI